jgi:hypothetical protein
MDWGVSSTSTYCLFHSDRRSMARYTAYKSLQKRISVFRYSFPAKRSSAISCGIHYENSTNQLFTYYGRKSGCRAVCLQNCLFVCLFRCFQMLLGLNLFSNGMRGLWIVRASAFALMCIHSAYAINLDNLLAFTVME